jgi:hypothetical protein
MPLTPEMEAEILSAHDANPKRFSPFKVSRQVGTSVAEVLRVVNSRVEGRTAPVLYNRDRVELAPYIIASRRVSDGCWDNDSEAIRDARAQVSAGTHTMATHRNGEWQYLCLFPLRRPASPNPNCFKPGAN